MRRHRLCSGGPRVLLGGLMFINVAWGHAAESLFWESRRTVARQAGLSPAGFPPPPPRRLSETPFSLSSPSLPPAWQWLEPLVRPYGTVGRFHRADDPGAPLVLQIQDVHGDGEAQKNIGEMIRVLRRERGVTLVGLEGAAGKISLEPYRVIPDPVKARETAAFFLREGIIGGPEHAALTAARPPRLWGVEDLSLYRANIRALRAAYPARGRLIADLANWERRAAVLRRRFFSPALASWDRHSRAFAQGREEWGPHVRFLATQTGRSLPPSLRQFLGVLDQEDRLDFQEVIRERRLVLERLSRPGSPLETASWMDVVRAYREGGISDADFFRFIETRCRERGVDLRGFPALSGYGEYVRGAARINGEALNAAIAAVEKTLPEALATTPEQKRLVRVGRRLRLLGRLVRQSLSPAEWEEYQPGDGDRVEADLRLLEGRSPATEKTAARSWAPFEEFCSRAVDRNAPLADHLLRAMAEDGTRVAAVVAGGFHTPGVSAALRRAGASFVVITPRVGDGETGGDLAEMARGVSSVAEGRIFLAAPVTTAESSEGDPLAAARRGLMDQVTQAVAGKELRDVAVVPPGNRPPDDDAVTVFDIGPHAGRIAVLPGNTRKAFLGPVSSARVVRAAFWPRAIPQPVPPGVARCLLAGWLARGDPAAAEPLRKSLGGAAGDPHLSELKALGKHDNGFSGAQKNGISFDLAVVNGRFLRVEEKYLWLRHAGPTDPRYKEGVYLWDGVSDWVPLDHPVAFGLRRGSLFLVPETDGFPRDFQKYGRVERVEKQEGVFARVRIDNPGARRIRPGEPDSPTPWSSASGGPEGRDFLSHAYRYLDGLREYGPSGVRETLAQAAGRLSVAGELAPLLSLPSGLGLSAVRAVGPAAFRWGTLRLPEAVKIEAEPRSPVTRVPGFADAREWMLTLAPGVKMNPTAWDAFVRRLEFAVPSKDDDSRYTGILNLARWDLGHAVAVARGDPEFRNFLARRVTRGLRDLREVPYREEALSVFGEMVTEIALLRAAGTSFFTVLFGRGSDALDERLLVQAFVHAGLSGGGTVEEIAGRLNRVVERRYNEVIRRALLVERLREALATDVREGAAVVIDVSPLFDPRATAENRFSVLAALRALDRWLVGQNTDSRVLLIAKAGDILKRNLVRAVVDLDPSLVHLQKTRASVATATVFSTPRLIDAQGRFKLSQVLAGIPGGVSRVHILASAEKDFDVTQMDGVSITFQRVSEWVKGVAENLKRLRFLSVQA